MAIQLKVTPDELKNKAVSIKTSITDIERELDDITATILGTKKYWQGDASDMHQQNFNKFKADIPSVIKELKGHPDELLKMADIYVETEKANDELAKALKIDPIL